MMRGDEKSYLRVRWYKHNGITLVRILINDLIARAFIIRGGTRMALPKEPISEKYTLQNYMVFHKVQVCETLLIAKGRSHMDILSSMYWWAVCVIGEGHVMDYEGLRSEVETVRFLEVAMASLKVKHLKSVFQNRELHQFVSKCSPPAVESVCKLPVICWPLYIDIIASVEDSLTEPFLLYRPLRYCKKNQTRGQVSL